MVADPDEVPDEELLRRARAGSEAALHRLLLRHQRIARVRARDFFVAGVEHDDLVQEGMIGLLEAVRVYDGSRDARFRTFAELCVSRQIVSAVRAAGRLKHGPLNGSLSLHRPVRSADGDQQPWDEVVAAWFADPAEHVLCAERLRELDRHVGDALSGFETRVLALHLDGRGYREIARLLDRPAKAVDNALQRIRRKLGERLAA